MGHMRSACPINLALESFGDAWSLLIIRDLMFGGKTTYTEFRSSDEAIATNVLASRLRHLQEVHLIQRQGTGRRAQYGLTQRGLDLLPMMLEIVEWGANDSRTSTDPAFLALLRRDPKRFAENYRRSLQMAHGLGIWGRPWDWS